MNILLFMENTHQGGLDTFVVNLIRAWPEAGDTFCVLANARHPGLDDLRSRLHGRAEVAAHGAPAYVDLVLSTGAGSALAQLRRLISPLLRAYCLVRGVSSLQRVFAARKAERLMIVSGGYPGGDSCLAAALAWSRSGRQRHPLLLNVHNLARCAPAWNLPARLWERWMDRRIARAAAAVVAVSHACAAALQLRAQIWQRAPVTYIHNGIEDHASADQPPSAVAREAVRIECGFDAQALLCIMLATYELRKGHRFLLDAFTQVLQRVPQARLLVCGSGTDAERARLAAECDARGLAGKVRLQGFRSDALRLLAAADLLVVPSQSFESFGLTCVEAMVRRVPVVATRTGGLPEVVVDEEGGYVVAHDDAAAFAARMTALLADPVLRRVQGERGRHRYERLFRAQRMAAQYAELLNQGKLPVHGRVNPPGPSRPDNQAMSGTIEQ